MVGDDKAVRGVSAVQGIDLNGEEVRNRGAIRSNGLNLGDDAVRGEQNGCDVLVAAEGGTVRADGVLDADQVVHGDGDTDESSQEVLAEQGR